MQNFPSKTPQKSPIPHLLSNEWTLEGFPEGSYREFKDFSQNYCFSHFMQKLSTLEQNVPSNTPLNSILPHLLSPK